MPASIGRTRLAKSDLLRDRRTPFVANCEAVRAFARVARISTEGEFASRAEETARAMAPLAAGQGPLAAHYVLAMRELSVRP